MASRRPLLKMEQVAELLGVHPATAYRLLEAGKLAFYQIGGSKRVDPDDLEAYLASCRREARTRSVRGPRDGARRAHGGVDRGQ